MMRSGATIIHGTNAPGALLREDARWWEMPPPQTKRQCVHAEPPISSETTDTKPRSRYRRFQPLWEPTGVVGPILPSPDLQGKDSSAVLGQILAIIPLQELICQPGCSLCCSPIAAELGGGWLCCPMHRPMGSMRARGNAGLGRWGGVA